MRNTIRICSYRKHVIYYDIFTRTYLVAIKRNGTDTRFTTIDDAYNAIDAIEDRKEA